MTYRAEVRPLFRDALYHVHAGNPVQLIPGPRVQLKPANFNCHPLKMVISVPVTYHGWLYYKPLFNEEKAGQTRSLINKSSAL